MIHWILKLQTEIVVSTMEAKYIALLTAMCDLIPLQTPVDEVIRLMNTDMLPC